MMVRRSYDMPTHNFTTDELRQLANINIRSVAQTCLLLSEADAHTYMNYVIIGLTAFKRGFNNEHGDDNGT